MIFRLKQNKTLQDAGLNADVDALNSPSLKMRNESDLTYDLKWTAWKWLYSIAGCRAIGFEVRLEGPFGRVIDVVGVGPGNLVYIVEVKSSRNDLKRDDRTKIDRDRVKAERTALKDAADLTSKILENARRVAVANSEESNSSGWRDEPAYRYAIRDHEEAVKKKEVKDRRLATFSIKFHDPAFLACADYHYLMAPDGLISASELPPFWGLLNEHGDKIVDAVPKQVPRNTAHVLRAIAKSNTRDLMKVCGIST